MTPPPACRPRPRRRRRAGLAFVPGIELSADPSLLGAAANDQLPAQEQPPAKGTLHILGYFVRHDDPELARLEQWLREARADRNPRIVERLNELGANITYEEVKQAAGGQVIGRPHIAQVLVKKGYVKSVHEAFARYIGEGAAAHVRKDRLSAADAIAAIHHAGGLAVLAHPVQLHLPRPGDLPSMVARLAALGLDGIEARHSDHTAADVKQFEQLATRHGLIATGGSDYHGKRKTVALVGRACPLRCTKRWWQHISSERRRACQRCDELASASWRNARRETPRRQDAEAPREEKRSKTAETPTASRGNFIFLNPQRSCSVFSVSWWLN